MRYNFEWDPNKARRNHEKHKVGFESAAEVFLDPLAFYLFSIRSMAVEKSVG